MALITATAAWVLVIQVGSIAMAPPEVVELSSASVSNGIPIVTGALDPAPAEPDVFVLSDAAGLTTTTRPSRAPVVSATTTTTRPVAEVVATTAPATTTTTVGVTATSRPNTPTKAVPATTTAAPTATTQAPPTTTHAAPPVTVPTPTTAAIATTTTTAAIVTTTTAAAPTTTTTVVAPTTTAAPVATGSFSAAAESDFASRINGLRSSVGLSGLASSGGLTNYARWWAKQMADSGNFAHSNISSLLNPWKVVGENVGYGPTAATIFSALVASPAHYNNIVDVRFTSVGVGAYTDSAGRIWTAHIFGG